MREAGKRLLRKWRVNEKIEEKWRENEKIERENGVMERGGEMEIYSLSHVFSFSPLNLHFLILSPFAKLFLIKTASEKVHQLVPAC